MQKIVVVDLKGQTHPFRLHEDAYDALRAYLDHARSRLGEDPAGSEVIDDLERSIGDRVAALSGPDDRVLAAADIAAVLDEVGAVEIGRQPSTGMAAPVANPRPRRRRLYRIREGQQISGVCEGLAVYADLDVAWVRTIFVFATLITAGFFLIVYLVMMFLLPVVDTRDEWIAAMRRLDETGAV